MDVVLYMPQSNQDFLALPAGNFWNLADCLKGPASRSPDDLDRQRTVTFSGGPEFRFEFILHQLRRSLAGANVVDNRHAWETGGQDIDRARNLNALMGHPHLRLAGTFSSDAEMGVQRHFEHLHLSGAAAFIGEGQQEVRLSGTDRRPF